jgi:hypothetical protein
MARADSQDLRDRVIDAALGGMPASTKPQIKTASLIVN